MTSIPKIIFLHEDPDIQAFEKEEDIIPSIRISFKQLEPLTITQATNNYDYDLNYIVQHKQGTSVVRFKKIYLHSTPAHL